MYSFKPVFLKVDDIAPLDRFWWARGQIKQWAESPPWGWFWWARGQKKQRGKRGAKQHKGGKNAQPLIDHWINFRSLLLWLVSFSQIRIYYDNRWRLLLKQFIHWIFTLDHLCAWLQCGLFQDYWALVKMTQLWHRSSSFHEHGSSSWALGFHECGSSSGALLFHGSVFLSFSHILILIVLVCLSWIENEIYQVQKAKRIYQTFWSNLVIFYNQRYYHEEIIEKQQSQVQTIQRIVTSRKVTQNNGNINNFWKGSRWFCRQCLRTFCYFLWPESRKWLFGKPQYICVWAFKHRPVPTDVVFCTRCMLCLLQSWRFQITALPGQAV